MMFPFEFLIILFYIMGDLLASLCKATSFIERPTLFPKNGEASTDSLNLFSETLEFYSMIYSRPPCLIISTMWGALLFLLWSKIIWGFEDWFVFWKLFEVPLCAIWSITTFRSDDLKVLLLNSYLWMAWACSMPDTCIFILEMQ